MTLSLIKSKITARISVLAHTFTNKIDGNSGTGKTMTKWLELNADREGKPVINGTKPDETIPKSICLTGQSIAFISGKHLVIICNDGNDDINRTTIPVVDFEILKKLR